MASEQYLIELFKDTQAAAFHAKRQTIQPKDMKFVLEIRGQNDPGYQ